MAMQPDRPERYLPLILRLPPGENRDSKITQILSALAEKSPDAAFAWLRAHGTPEFAGVAARMNGKLIGDLAATDPSAALARWQTLPDGSVKNLAAGNLAQNWAKTDPAAAARWYAARLPATPPDERLFLSITSSLLRSHSGSGELRGKDDSEEKLTERRTFISTTRAWAQKEPVAALHWAETLPDAAQRQLAIAVIGTADNRPPENQADLLAQIQSPSVRLESLGEHFQHWLQKDPPAARAWLDTHDALSPEQTARLLKQAEDNARSSSSHPASR